MTPASPAIASIRSGFLTPSPTVREIATIVFLFHGFPSSKANLLDFQNIAYSALPILNRYE